MFLRFEPAFELYRPSIRIAINFGINFKIIVIKAVLKFSQRIIIIFSLTVSGNNIFNDKINKSDKNNFKTFSFYINSDDNLFEILVSFLI